MAPDIARTAKNLSAGPLTRWICLFAALIIALSAISLTFVGLTASREADRHALINEKRLFENALLERHVDMAQDQLGLAQWDKSVKKIDLNFDQEFVEDEFVEYLWHDFELERNFLIAPNNTILADAFRGRTDFDKRHLKPGTPLAALANTSRQLFMTNRVRIKNGYAQAAVTPRTVSEVATYAFAELDGQLAMLSAMAIVPDDGSAALKDRDPVILISGRYIDAAFLADLNSQLDLPDLSFSNQESDNPSTTEWQLRNFGGAVIGTFTWNGLKPGAKIWAMIVPLILALSTVLTCAAVFIGRKIGRLSSSLEESEQKHRYNAQHDPLTGLANRHKFSECLSSALDNLPAQGFSLIACDLDRFKAVNDTYGHAAGDTVICTVAERLSAAVGNDGVVGRIGGDEFVILTYAKNTHQDLIYLSRSILKAIQLPIDIGNRIEVSIGISLGLASAPTCGTSEAQLIAAADKALYAAKEDGRNTACFAAPLPENEPAWAATPRNNVA